MRGRMPFNSIEGILELDFNKGGKKQRNEINCHDAEHEIKLNSIRQRLHGSLGVSVTLYAVGFNNRKDEFVPVHF